MNQQQPIEDQLWAYIDGLGTDAERATVATRLQTDVQWQHIYSQLLLFNDSLQQNLQPTQPGDTFTAGVMNKIAAQSTLAPTNGKPMVMKGIAAFFLLSLLGLVVYTLSQINWGGAAWLQAPTAAQLPALLPNGLLNIILCATGAIVLLLYAEMWLRHKRTHTA
jgi:anti-sigma factor RsiW